MLYFLPVWAKFSTFLAVYLGGNLHKKCTKILGEFATYTGKDPEGGFTSIIYML